MQARPLILFRLDGTANDEGDCARAYKYPDYNHATGHLVGGHAHNSATSIPPKGYKRSEIPIRENGVYTIEPRIQIPNSDSIEEMTMVTKNRGMSLCAPPKTFT